LGGSRKIGWAAAVLATLALVGAGVHRVYAQVGVAPGSLDTKAVESLAQSTCAACHGSGLTGGDRAPALVNSAHLRTLGEGEIKAIIRSGTAGGMPSFPFPDNQLDALATWLKGQNDVAVQAHPPEQVAAGQALFFGKAGCSACHMVRGRGGVNGPDLSALAVRSTPSEIEGYLDDPTAQMGTKSLAGCPGWAFCPDTQWGVVDVRLKGGKRLRGFARNQGEHDLQLQTFDGQFRLLTDKDYVWFKREPKSYMPPLHATPDERRDLLAYLGGLLGVPLGPQAGGAEPSAQAVAAVMRPAKGQWPSYNGTSAGNRYSALDQINRTNVRGLALQWSFTPGGAGLQTTPLVSDGVMYVTGAAQVCALDARTGRRIWCTPRTAPKVGAGPARTPGFSAPATGGANRGVALLGDRLFFSTDDAHLVAVNRVTGAPMWAVALPDPKYPGAYYGAAAPLVVGDLVIAGVAGGDSPLRGFVAAYRASTGEQVWRLWTIPLPGEPLSETWKGRDLPTGGGATWTTGSYDVDSGVLYWAVGNPYPATNGDERGGSNLYTGSVLAIDPKTGTVKWHFQFSPHDLHDWDANEPLVLADARFGGRDRKLLMQANRNGIFYVLDRTTGQFLLGKPFVKKLTWASGIGSDGTPLFLPNNEPTEAGVRTCPSVRGATNWYASSYSPQSRLFYVMAAEDCSIYRKVGRGYDGDRDPSDPGLRYLRAINPATGAIVWEKPMVGAQEANYAGVMSTGGGLVFHGETGGGFAAVDALTGKTLWIFRANDNWRAAPMTYTLDGRQYVAVAAGGNILSFALGQDPYSVFGAPVLASPSSRR
jgi:PQQ-dependent dehydrogenase (methanol/ethanol family)